jgi:hypothetical protein
LPKATALSREECLIAALEQRVVIGDMLNGKLKAHCETFYRTSRLARQSAFRPYHGLRRSWLACDVVCHVREWVGCQLNVDS